MGPWSDVRRETDSFIGAVVRHSTLEWQIPSSERLYGTALWSGKCRDAV
jgi:hypothetical protein